MQTESKSWNVTIEYGEGRTVSTALAGLGLQTEADVREYARKAYPGGRLTACVCGSHATPAPVVNEDE